MPLHLGGIAYGNYFRATDQVCVARQREMSFPPPRVFASASIPLALNITAIIMNICTFWWSPVVGTDHNYQKTMPSLQNTLLGYSFVICVTAIVKKGFIMSFCLWRHLDAWVGVLIRAETWPSIPWSKRNRRIRSFRSAIPSEWLQNIAESIFYLVSMSLY